MLRLRTRRRTRSCAGFADVLHVLKYGVVLCTVLGAGLSLTAPSLLAQKKPDPSPPTKPAQATPHSTLVGVVIDSIHGGPLPDATILLDGTTFTTTTGPDGTFRFDTLPPGDYRIAVFHPVLDTLGIAIGTPALRMGVDSVRQVMLATPSQKTMVEQSCPPNKRLLGPGAILGRVTEPDTDTPLDSVRVSVVWSQVDVGVGIGLRRTQKVRQATTDATGKYVLCGLPANIQGTIQAELPGSKTAEVPVTIGGDALLSVQMLHLLPQVASDTAPLVGKATLTGRVADQMGVVVADARIQVDGARNTGTTGKDGEFSMSGLPSGMRTVTVRRIGYAPAQLAVDLSAQNPARISVRLQKAAPSIGNVRIEAEYTAALKKNGFTDRKKMGLGRFLTPEDIAKRQPLVFSDLFTTMAGFRVQQGQNGNTITGTRGQNQCVVFWVDGVQYRESTTGELDQTLRPEQLLAIETYSASSAPMEFQVSGKSSCAVIVAWTNRTVRPEKTERKQQQ